jgi:hypothetical protein
LKQKPSRSSNLTPEQLNKLVEKVPEWLRVTPEIESEIHKQQKNLRDRFSQRFHKPSDDELNLQIAINYEQMARQFFIAVDSGATVTDKEIQFNRRRLAQALRDQGKYVEAIVALARYSTPRSEAEAKLRDELDEEIHALERKDDDFCSCTSPDGFPTTHTVKKLRKPSGEIVPVIRCISCGHLNATSQKPEELSKIENIRSQPHKLSDREILKRQ